MSVDQRDDSSIGVHEFKAHSEIFVAGNHGGS